MGDSAGTGARPADAGLPLDLAATGALNAARARSTASAPVQKPSEPDPPYFRSSLRWRLRSFEATRLLSLSSFRPFS